jgi:hypothetical protein
MNYFTKKIGLFTSFFLLIVYIVSYYNKILNLPSNYKDFCCVDDRTFNLFLIFVPIFIFALATHIIRGNWSSWAKFTNIYLIFYLVVYFLVPTQGDGLIWFQRETVSFIGTSIYSLVSLVIVLYKSFKKN